MNLAKDLLNRKLAFDYLTTPSEREELHNVDPIAYAVKLRYRGIQKTPWGPERLWDIISQEHPYNGSTRTIEGLKELGII